ncbi:type I polyketide synthase [Micromonospora sp. NPDC050200]|uniref:type I polyketide synthase n=1 Tax=Micromonospora sp. NPDC050200 TaxID=3155664 RepID=UPI0033CB01B6
MGTAETLAVPGPPRRAVTAPVAVVGIGCRFAGGVDSPDSFWDLLASGGDGIGELPEERWQAYGDLGPDYAAALRRATRFGGFLSEIEGFDADFFGLSPREAELMDPQQRILLEVAWEALEHAGMRVRELAGTDVGVFVGVGSDDYGRRLLEDLPRIEAWTGIGAAMCAVANRISYALDFRGPSLAVDTACSASLVALHLACQSLRAGETPVALAAGVNLIVSPGLTLTLDAAGAMAPDGRCKSFDVTADGYGRGEGCGVVVLKLLADAQRDGDRVLAVIRGSAVNQDGRTNGIMAPSGPAQEHVLDRACRQAGIAPGSVSYVEAHGTGTRLGDPLEAGALSAVYGVDRAPGEPCLIGSVKSNIGHLEAAAGVASIIKVVLALHRSEIPPSLNHSVGNPAIDWDSAGLQVVTERTAWPRGDEPRRAGVSGFGYGGTVAHVLVEEAPEEAGGSVTDDAGAHDVPRLFPISASSDAALRQHAQRMADWLSASAEPASLASIGHTLALRRSHLRHRAAVVAASRDELAARLRHLAAGEPAPGVTSGADDGGGTGLVWVFSGHGSQWVGMGRELLRTEPVFAAVIDQLEPIFLEEIGFSPRQVLLDDELRDVDRIQTMIFVMQLGLAEVWRSSGLRPDAVIGHSVGEIAAAVTAGALTVEAGARLICRRSRLLRQVAGNGAMAMVGLPFDEVAKRLADRTDVGPAIWSSPASTVIAGDIEVVDALVARWRDENIAVRRVASDVAFHSPQMDPLLAELTEAAADLAPERPRIPMYRTALPDPRSEHPVEGAYWAANLRNPVLLTPAVQAAVEDGYRVFLEISAHPVVAHSISETLSYAGHEDGLVVSTLRRNAPERERLLTNAAVLHCHGVALDWPALQPAGDLVTLPGVPWQHRRLWRDPASPSGIDGSGHDVASHTVLGSRVSIAGTPLRMWRTRLTDDSRPYPGSHTINGAEVTPAAILINTFLGARDEGPSVATLTDVSFQIPLLTREPRDIQVVHDHDVLRLASRTPAADGPWLVHATALIAKAGSTLPEQLPGRLGELEQTDPDAVRRQLASVGVPTMAFDWTIEKLWRGDNRIRARVRIDLPPTARTTWAPVFDAALSIAPFAHPGPPALRMVAGIDEVHTSGAPLLVVDVEITADPGDDALTVLLADPTGRVVARLAGLRLAEMEPKTRGRTGPVEMVHEVVWRPLALPAAAPDGSAAPAPRRIAFVGPDSPLAAALRERLTAAGASCLAPSHLGDLDLVGEDTDLLLLPPSPDSPAPVTGAVADAAWLLITVVQRLSARHRSRFPRLWCLTVGVGEGTTESHLAHAPLWGLGRVVAGEHPELWGGIVDLPPEAPAEAAELLLDVLRARPREDIVVLRDGTPSVARLVPTERAPVRGPVRCRADGTYLVTGGLGVLGLQVCHWLAERGARRIVIAGRRGLPTRDAWDLAVDDVTRRQITQVRALEALGVTVRVLALDIADPDQVARQLAPETLGLPPICGVVHAAGVLDNRMLRDVDRASLDNVLRPKVEGAWALHGVFPPGSVDFFVLFSSCGYLLGIPGQATYGSANAFLDAFARYRNHAASGPDGTLSLGWTSWHGQGMAVNEVVDAELRARGVGDISVVEAFSAWDHAEERGGGMFPVLRVTPLEPGEERLPLLAELSDSSAAPAPTGPTGQNPPAIVDLPPEQLRQRLMEDVGGQIADEMKLPATTLDPRRSLIEQGLDSVMTIVIRRRLERRYGHKLPSTLLWHQPTVTAIIEHLAGLLQPAEPENVEEVG